MVEEEKIHNGTWLIPLVVSILGSVGGAGGGSYLYFSRLAPSQLESLARPDPFTGAEAQELTRRITEVEKRVALLPPRELTTEVALLRREIELLREEIETLKR